MKWLLKIIVDFKVDGVENFPLKKKTARSFALQ